MEGGLAEKKRRGGGDGRVVGKLAVGSKSEREQQPGWVS